MAINKLLLNNLKNIWGWKTQRKIVVISVDDYGMFDWIAPKLVQKWTKKV